MANKEKNKFVEAAYATQKGKATMGALVPHQNGPAMQKRSSFFLLHLQLQQKMSNLPPNLSLLPRAHLPYHLANLVHNTKRLEPEPYGLESSNT